jgi:hypothetical protein
VHNEELHNLYSSPSITRMMKSKIRWTGHVARMGAKRHAKSFRGIAGRKETNRKT